MHYREIVLLSVLLPSCIPAEPNNASSTDVPPARGEATEPSQPTMRQLMGNPQQLVGHVAWVRGLEVRRNVPFFVDDDQPFLEALTGGSGESDNRGLFLSFGLETGEKTRERRSIAEALQVDAFYSRKTGKIHVKKSTLDHDQASQKFLIAHEIGHALQHQNLKLDFLDSASSPDQALARLALVEGDAQLTGLAYLADTFDLSLRKALVKTSKLIDDGAISSAHGKSKYKLSTSEKSISEFPYTKGLLFAGALYRAGGWPLVSGAYSAPPASTEQILHPEKYVAGEQPIPVATPTPPPGTTLVARGNLGELVTGLVLERCAKKKTAHNAAEGWGGDAYAIWKTPQGSNLLAWSTAWDDEPSAEFFADTIEQGADCWAKAPVEASSDVQGPYRVQRQGKRVALLRGAIPADPSPLFSALLALPGATPPAAPPLGSVRIPPVPQAPRARRGRINGAFYENETLGIRALLPPGFSADVDTTGMKLDARFRGEGSFAALSMGVEELVFSERSQRRIALAIYQGFMKGMRGVLPDARLAIIYQGPAQTSLGEGWAMEWLVPGTPLFLRIVLLPICDRSGVIWVLHSGSHESLKQNLNASLSNLWWTTSDPPICRTLNP